MDLPPFGKGEQGVFHAERVPSFFRFYWGAVKVDTVFVGNETTSQSPVSCLSTEQRYGAFLEFLPDPVFVFNLDDSVSYLNPAFEKVFGWALAETEGKIVPFVPDAKEQTRLGIEKLYREKAIHGFETQRLTRDGRLLDIVVDGAIFYDDQGRPAGQVITFGM